MSKKIKHRETLIEMIEKRKGSCDPWLLPQVITAAQIWDIMDRVSETLMKEELTTLEVGSQGQTKTVVNPLVPYYDKLQRTFMLALEALGLNFRTTPTKVDGARPAGVADDDPLACFLQSTKIE